MLPITNVIAKFVPKNRVSEVVGVEVHVEDVYRAIAMIVDDDAGRSSVRSETIGVGANAKEVCWLGCDVDFRGKVDIATIEPILVEEIEVRKIEWRAGWRGQRTIVKQRRGVADLCRDVGGVELFFTVEPDKGSCFSVRHTAWADA